MGNVLATSKPITSAANQFLGANPETGLGTEQDADKTTSEPIENPGTMEDLHKKCKGLSSNSCHFPKDLSNILNRLLTCITLKSCYVTTICF